jgi:signal transduction histidine kinase
MRDRLIAVGGTLEITSPAGGPTTIVGELPCGS